MKNLSILLLFFTHFLQASPYAKPSEAHGILKFNQPHPSKNVFPVEIYQLNEKQITARKTPLWLKPGIHRIKVSAQINSQQLSHFISRRIQSGTTLKNEITIKVEEGNIYYVGYDADSHNPSDWKPIVWKTKKL